ncbi:MAG: extracellular solute-binding protein [Actinomycetota bacterium]|nr:extracellular solute-binding protein [Actinomycetota bacterium]
MRRTLRAIGLGAVAASLGFGALLSAPPANAATTTIVIWTDENRSASVRELFANGYKGYTVQVVVKDFGQIRDDLSKVTESAAPDVIVGAHDWVGELAANGSIVKLNVPAKAVRETATYALQGFRYGSGIYGMPTQIENVALVTNASLIKTQPKTFAELSKMALALKKAGKVTVPFAVPQGANGDAYHMYPLFSGLGGYIFGTNPSGSVNPKKVGLDNATFRKNQNLINAWNKSGLINSKVDYGIAKDAFVAGKAPFWITGPWEINDTIKKLGFKYRITAVPTIVDGITPVPFLGAQGFMVTKFAAIHGVQIGANSLVAEYMSTAPAQAKLAAANGRTPANLIAAKAVSDPQLKAFGAAGVGGVPMPNVPQMASVWSALGGAWVNSTKGAGATPAQKAFAQAQATVVKAIG